MPGSDALLTRLSVRRTMLQSEATRIDERKSMGRFNLVKQHRSRVWLVNTGWGGGAYGTGKRISLKHTRAIIDSLFRENLRKYESGVTAEIKSAGPA